MSVESLRACVVAVLGGALAFTAVCRTASGQETPTSTSTSAPTEPASDSESESASEPAPAPSSPLRWSVGINPIAFFIGRFGGDVEYAAAPHLALLGNLHLDTAAVLTDSSSDPYVGFGAELGVRLYSVRDEARGGFLGASLVGGWYSIEYYGTRLAVPDAGFAIDFGGKARIGERGFLTLGLGVEHLSSGMFPKDVDGLGPFVFGSGWKPRLIVTAGASFH
jgi:hypothetical protein